MCVHSFIWCIHSQPLISLFWHPTDMLTYATCLVVHACDVIPPQGTHATSFAIVPDVTPNDEPPPTPSEPPFVKRMSALALDITLSRRGGLSFSPDEDTDWWRTTLFLPEMIVSSHGGRSSGLQTPSRGSSRSASPVPEIVVPTTPTTPSTRFCRKCGASKVKPTLRFCTVCGSINP